MSMGPEQLLRYFGLLKHHLKAILWSQRELPPDLKLQLLLWIVPVQLQDPGLAFFLFHQGAI